MQLVPLVLVFIELNSIERIVSTGTLVGDVYGL